VASRAEEVGEMTAIHLHMVPALGEVIQGFVGPWMGPTAFAAAGTAARWTAWT
jgi:hypothetical protein